MKTLSIVLFIQGFALIGTAVYSGGWNMRQLATFAYFESTLREPFKILKQEDSDAFSRVSYTEAGVDQTLDFLKRRSEAFGTLEGVAILIGCLSIIEALIIIRKKQNEK